MKNIYDIREDKNLFWVLSKDGLDKIEKINNACVVIYLYYLDTIYEYFEYILELNDSIDVVIISSKQEIIDKGRRLFEKKGLNRVSFRIKENRGRDVAALLVTAADLFEKYEYICFLHDKKEKCESEKKAADEWVNMMWSSMLGSESLVSNILGIFKNNLNIGLLLPPEPDTLGGRDFFWSGTGWYNDLDITLSLAGDLRLNADIKADKPPIAIGTCFWCRTDAIKKLIYKDWKYEDFPEEPLSLDGTISHAVERIFPYVAQDAGYDSGTVFTKDFIKNTLGSVLGQMRRLYRLSRDYIGIDSKSEVYNFDKRMNLVKDYFDTHSRVFIYGTGMFAERYTRFLTFCGKEVDGYIITNGVQRDFMNKRVYEVDEYEFHEGDGIIIGVSEKIRGEIIAELESRKIKDYLCI